MIDKSSPVPLYYQIAEHFREQIASGELASGSRLPGERELSEQLGVSRMTVRQALNYLQRNGLIEVRKGVGAFVAQPKQTYDALHLLGFSEEIGRRGDQVESIVLEQAIVEPPPRVAQRLALEEGGRTVKLSRLRKVNQEPMLLETSYIPAALCPGLEQVDLAANSLYKVLESRYGLRLERAQQTMECAAATPYEQSLFGLHSGAGVLLLEGVVYAERDLPIEYFKAIYRGDRCKFQLESWRDGEVRTGGVQRMSVVVA
ncbi:GntR family transcriptional regulator [Caldilinea sp.]|uniref:GntR family transcriptional regulator n=1 Tax=Caldilinea sp. TaxID=2293560 RepID=UPI00260FF063|nr:GntR family transcriptional regulator [uncultured Caldilinea sp.]